MNYRGKLDTYLTASPSMSHFISFAPGPGIFIKIDHGTK